LRGRYRLPCHGAEASAATPSAQGKGGTGNCRQAAGKLCGYPSQGFAAPPVTWRRLYGRYPAAPAQTHTVSQDFETVNDTFDNQSCEDISSRARWPICNPELTRSTLKAYIQRTGPAASFNVYFYQELPRLCPPHLCGYGPCILGYLVTLRVTLTSPAVTAGGPHQLTGCPMRTWTLLRAGEMEQGQTTHCCPDNPQPSLSGNGLRAMYGHLGPQGSDLPWRLMQAFPTRCIYRLRQALLPGARPRPPPRAQCRQPRSENKRGLNSWAWWLLSWGIMGGPR